MFAAKDIDFATIPEGEPMREGTAAGRGFAVSGGVAGAVKDLIHQTHPDLEIKGYLLEGMACPGGCVAGAGTLLPIDLAAAVVGRYQKEAGQESPMSSKYRDVGEHLD